MLARETYTNIRRMVKYIKSFLSIYIFYPSWVFERQKECVTWKLVKSFTTNKKRNYLAQGYLRKKDTQSI